MRAYGLSDQVALVTNPTVGSLYAESVIRSLQGADFQVTSCVVPDGEAFKTLASVRTLYDAFIEAGLDRRGVVAALGGGVVGDMAGFAADTYLRGVPFVQMPTSLLSMVDSSVGGKVAVDHPHGKNLIGAFKQPELVLIDTDALASLPPRELACGLAEVVKTALIGDSDLFAQIETHGPAPLPWLIARSVAVKIGVVEEDPFEQGRRAVLNLGHTFGHALELLSDYALSHGEGVSIGLAAATRLSANLGFCDPELVPRIEGLLTRLGLPRRYAGHTPDQVWQAMGADKKRRGTTLRFILLRGVGEVFVTEAVTKTDVFAVLDELRDEQVH
jgi:3-dehydroquinate synthase